MFGVGLPEIMVILVVGLIVFGPDRIPDMARQAGRMVRQVRRFTQQARDDIRSELGPEFAEFELTDLDPRRALRKHLQEVWDEAEEEEPPPGRRTRGLAEGERPPYDHDAT